MLAELDIYRGKIDTAAEVKDAYAHLLAKLQIGNRRSEDGLAGHFAIKVSGFETETAGGSQISGDHADVSAMIGYAFVGTRGDVQLLAGIQREYTDTEVAGYFSNRKVSTEIGALKFGLSSYSVIDGDAVLSCNVYFKHYGGESAEIIESFGGTGGLKLEGDIGLGVKFGGLNSGFQILAKLGWENNLLGSGARFGVGVGYLF